METNINATSSEPLPLGLPARSLIVSIHDVSPSNFEATKKILSEINALGVSAASLLIIPNHHYRGSFLDDYAFCQWLKERVSHGDEAVIHGYYHIRNSRSKETIKDKLTTRFYTAGEGEFFDIHGAHAIQLLSEARNEFNEIGIVPSGFIAPAWLLSEGAEKALKLLRFSYTTKLTSIIKFPTETIYPSQSLVWSVRSGWRRICSLLWNAYLFRHLKKSPVLRVSIHPVDIEHPAIWRQICKIITLSLKDRHPITYAHFVKNAEAANFLSETKQP